VPELPEVEVTRRRIAPLLVGRRIRVLRTTRPSYFFVTPPGRLRRALAGRTVEGLGRRGKYLLARLDDGQRLVVHLGMTGQLFASTAASERLLSASGRAALAPEAQIRFRPDAHTHLRFCFEDGGAEVYLRDARKFGKVLLLGAGESHPRLDRLGTDALEATGEALYRATRRRTAAIKAVLLDQSVIAGVGNIYADEALFLAGVRPGRRASRVTRRECAAIVDAIHRVMRRSIETGGSSISDYVAPDGSDGAYQDERRVYARDGEPCAACGDRVRKRIVAQRGTHYCPHCQR
jgi:formamidopyrimidine-DNA glycosylase